MTLMSYYMEKTYKSYLIESWVRGEAYIREAYDSNGNKKQFRFTSRVKISEQTCIKKVKRKNLCVASEVELPKNSRVKDYKIWQYPEHCDRREYNKIWMHNYRVMLRINKLKKLTKENDG